MADLLQELEDTLAEEIRLHRALVELAKRKRDALVAVDTATVDGITRREQSILLAVGPTAASRLRLTAAAAASMGLPEHAGVGEIAGRAAEPYGSALRKRARELRDVLTELGRLTRLCRSLTEESLGFVKRFFRILSTAGQEAGGYTRTGAPPVPPARLLFDQVV